MIHYEKCLFQLTLTSSSLISEMMEMAASVAALVAAAPTLLARAPKAV